MDESVTSIPQSDNFLPRRALSRESARRLQTGWRLAAGFLLIAAFLSASCSNSGAGSKSLPGAGKRTSDAGSVTVDLTWDGREAGLVFTVAMDTHSVDLDGFDLVKLALLRTDLGVEVVPVEWDAGPGGHHREGKLSFPAAVDGRPLLGESVRGFTVIVRDIAVPERSFQWKW
ncbi:MAG: hypothetical protein IH609_00595 [Dehalococcoidia bacterium]|nr:hypothetical protein [Dehalococcoidia bacterium]